MVAQLVPAQRAPVQGCELLTNLVARRIARLAALDQRAPRAEHQGLHLGRVAAEHGGHLRVGEITELGQEKRRPLLIWQLGQVSEQLTQLGAPLDVLGESGRRDVGVERDVVAP